MAKKDQLSYFPTRTISQQILEPLEDNEKNSTKNMLTLLGQETCLRLLVTFDALTTRLLKDEKRTLEEAVHVSANTLILLLINMAKIDAESLDNNPLKILKGEGYENLYRTMKNRFSFDDYFFEIG